MDATYDTLKQELEINGPTLMVAFGLPLTSEITPFPHLRVWPKVQPTDQFCAILLKNRQYKTDNTNQPPFGPDTLPCTLHTLQ